MEWRLWHALRSLRGDPRKRALRAFETVALHSATARKLGFEGVVSPYPPYGPYGYGYNYCY
jgi:hypothetical protein